MKKVPCAVEIDSGLFPDTSSNEISMWLVVSKFFTWTSGLSRWPFMGMTTVVSPMRGHVIVATAKLGALLSSMTTWRLCSPVAEMRPISSRTTS